MFHARVHRHSLQTAIKRGSSGRSPGTTVVLEAGGDEEVAVVAGDAVKLPTVAPTLTTPALLQMVQKEGQKQQPPLQMGYSSSSSSSSRRHQSCKPPH